MRVGTKSILWGYHAFWLHGWFVLAAWLKYFPRPTWQEMVSIFSHDFGYWGLRAMDDEAGKAHPYRSWRFLRRFGFRSQTIELEILYHSRYIAKRHGVRTSRLAVADKAAFLLYPKWLLFLLYHLSGEADEYMANFLGFTAYEIYSRPQVMRLRRSSPLIRWSAWYRWATKGNEDFLVAWRKENDAAHGQVVDNLTKRSQLSEHLRALDKMELDAADSGVQTFKRNNDVWLTAQRFYSC